MKFNTFETDLSPFHQIDEFQETKKDDRVSMRTDISPEDYRLFEKYFEQRPDEIDRSKFVKELLIDFLNNNAFEKKSFENLQVIMLLPKHLKDNELQSSCEIIGFLHDEDVIDVPMHMFKGNVNYTNNYNFIYTLKEFNELNYNLIGFQKLNKPCFINVGKHIQHDFEKVKARLNELYERIDLDDAYFVIFNLNNYLDELNQGVYVSKSSRPEDRSHDGVIVLIEDFYSMAYLFINWSYVQGHVHLFVVFEDGSEFSNKTINETNVEGVIKEYRSITIMVTREQGLRDKKAHALEMIKHYKRMCKHYDKELKKLEK